MSPLDTLEEPESLTELRGNVDGLLPEVELPKVILEVDAWTSFATSSHTAAAQRPDSRIYPPACVQYSLPRPATSATGPSSIKTSRH